MARQEHVIRPAAGNAGRRFVARIAASARVASRLVTELIAKLIGPLRLEIIQTQRKHPKLGQRVQFARLGDAVMVLVDPQTPTEILDGHTPKAKYTHMREIAHQIKGFNRKLGWDDNSAFGLSNKCLIYMSRLDKTRFKMFYCAVDMKAYHKLRAENYQIPEPIELCNRFCSESVLAWWLSAYDKTRPGGYPDKIDPMADTIRYFFDRNEYFKRPFEDKWNAEKDRAAERGEWSVWQRVKEVAAVDMKSVPGVQAADIIAWAVNRENIVQHGEKASYMAHVIRQVIPAWSVVWDEAKFKKHFTRFEPADHSRA